MAPIQGIGGRTIFVAGYKAGTMHFDEAIVVLNIMRISDR